MAMQIRVYYEDTDCGGIVYHANYLKYCERARSESFFKAGIPPFDNGIGFVVKAMQIQFLSPAKLGDLLDVRTHLITHKMTSLTLAQSIFLQENALFKAQLTLVYWDANTQKITKIPPKILQHIKGFL